MTSGLNSGNVMIGKMEEMGNGGQVVGGHELLRGDHVSYPNKLSARQMETLMAICDTFLPSVDISSRSKRDSLVTFYGTSASKAGRTMENVGGALSGKLKHPMAKWVRVVLWFLSTRWGTFALCGRSSLSPRFPFFKKFALIPPNQRESILLAWSRCWLNPIRMLFKSIKMALMITFFTQVNERNENPAWKAIGYCGPDPRFSGRPPTSTAIPDESTNNSSKHDHGPLHGNVLDATTSEPDLSRSLRSKGFFTTPRTATSPFTIHCDAVVVGSGSGGSVVAGVLAKAGHKVLVVEKGRYFSRDDLTLLEGPSAEQMYEGSALVATDDLGVVVLAGATVGGGSTINWSACIRTPDHILEEWRTEHGLELFGTEDFKKALDVVCERMGVQSEDLGDEGFANAVLRKGCSALGLPVKTVPRNSPPNHSCGWCHLGCKDGKKQGMTETFLADAVTSGNGVILQDCTVTNVIVDKNVAKGVIATNGTQTIAVNSAVTIVAGGALNTPALLKKSGLKNPNIGKNLHLHPVVMAWGYFPEPSWPEKEKTSYEGGIITAMSTTAPDFDTPGYHTIIQAPVLHPGMFAGLTPWVSSEDFRRRMTNFSRTTHIFALARDRGSGDSGDYPGSLKYKLDVRDEENLGRGMETVLRALVAAGAAEVGTQHGDGGWFDVRTGTEEELERFVREAGERRLGDLKTPICSAHQMGSCRMGAEVESSAVRVTGETWDVEGLFVADTSVFPTAVGVNPMVTVMAISYCTAVCVLDRLRA